ncbi:IS1634 family transposase [Nonomuraea sp. K274]|uniref:IS1634 family transposase n=1 Tax=Nonomuraea cypriaca TaxID=1187855 RepID=A0A931AHB6_9ACTN|nr:IS1634 family transposase [Nonomuraea cypriaca]
MKTRVMYGPPSVEKALGSLPVIADFCGRLGIAEIVDELCPIREVARVSHGQVVEALIANRLTSPASVVRLENWARCWAVPEVLGIKPDALNDDRVGRALDAIAEHLEVIAGTVGARAITEFGVEVSRIHWDMTSISLYGDYAQAEEEFAQPKYGHPKDRRPDLKQIQAGIGTTADGAVPIFSRVYDGGAAEVSQVTGAMRGLQKIAGRRELLLLGDSKLISYDNVRELGQAGVTFIAPAPKAVVPATVLAALDLAQATRVDYVALRDQGKPPDRRGGYHVIEDAMILTPPKSKTGKNLPELPLRRIFVHSTARAGAAATARAKKLQRARAELDRLARGAGGRHYPTEDTIAARVSIIAKTRRVAACLRHEIGTDPSTGKPTFTWHYDQQAIAHEAATDGWYALLTTVPATGDTALDAPGILLAYKGQEASERRYGNLKGPLAVAPLFLATNRRIAALITVICLALLIFALIERAVRLLAGPTGKIAGLYVGRPARPTGRLIFEALAEMRLIPAQHGRPALIPRPNDLQQHILTILTVDPIRTISMNHPP